MPIYKRLLKKSLISAAQQAPPFNRKPISFSSVVCVRKVCVGSNDPDLSVLFEFAQLKQALKTCVLVFFLPRGKKKSMANKKESDTKSVC